MLSISRVLGYSHLEPGEDVAGVVVVEGVEGEVAPEKDGRRVGFVLDVVVDQGLRLERVVHFD